MDKKILVAYFSCSGVTAKAAKALAAAAKADLIEIRPKVPYTPADLDWTDSNSRSSLEMKDRKSRPELAEKPVGINGYDVIFVGFPIWWSVAPTIVNTFLESCDLSGKTVIPFATSGGSGMGKSADILRRSCSEKAKVDPGKLLNAISEKALNLWLRELGI